MSTGPLQFIQILKRAEQRNLLALRWHFLNPLEISGRRIEMLVLALFCGAIAGLQGSNPTRGEGPRDQSVGRGHAGLVLAIC